MAELETTITGAKCRSHAKAYLETKGGGVDSSANKDLLKRLSKFDSGMDEEGKVNVSSVGILKPIHCKPTFFDIAYNFVDFPKLVLGEKSEEEEEEEESEEEEEEGGGGGGLLSWFRR